MARSLLLAIASAIAFAIAAPAVADELPPSPGVVAELHTGLNTPLGSTGFALVVPWRRVAAGAGFGYTTWRTTTPPGLGGNLAGAAFARFTLVEGERLHLAVTAGLSRQWRETDTRVSTTRIYRWNNSGPSYDVGLVGELAVGPLWLGVEAGVRRTAAAPTCTGFTAAFMSGQGPYTQDVCDPMDTRGRPSQITPYLGLSLRHRGDPVAGEASVGGTAPPAPEPRGRRLRLFVRAAAVDAIELRSDGHFFAETDDSGAIEAEMVWSWGGHFRLGLGARYELAYGRPSFGSPPILDHFFYVPVLIGAAIPLAGRHEIEGMVGGALVAGLIDDGGHRFMHAYGAAVEATLTYWLPVTRSVDLALGAAVSGSLLSIIDSGISDGGARGVLPLRAGVRW